MLKKFFIAGALALVHAPLLSAETPADSRSISEYVIERLPYFKADAAHRTNVNIHTPTFSEIEVRHAPAAARGTGDPAHRIQSVCAQWKKEDASIVACSPNFERYASDIPNDPLSLSQWPLYPPDNSVIGVNFPDTSFEFATAPVIAIIDTGIDLHHPDLASSLWQNPLEIPGNHIDDDANGYVDDIHGADVVKGTGDPSLKGQDHGTQVAGIIASTPHNGIGIRGFSGGIPIMMVKADSSRGVFSVHGFTQALDYVTNLKVRGGINVVAINASLGGSEASEVELRALERAHDAGIMVVTSAGNEASNIDSYPVYPASYELPNILSVAATDSDGSRAYFSNYGILGVDVAAPGVDILTTLPGGGYGLFSGTSAAAPIVTSLAALIQANFAQLSIAQVKRVLLASGRDTSLLRSYTLSGKTVDFWEAIRTARTFTEEITTQRSSQLDLYDGIFSVEGSSSKGISEKHTLKTISLTVRREDFVLNPGLATLILQFRVGNYLCERLVKVSEINRPSFKLQTSIRAPRSSPPISVLVLNGESEITGSSKIKLRRGKRSNRLGLTREALRRKRVNTCNALVLGLNFAQ